MLGDAPSQAPRFHALRFMATLKAARDFGLGTETANAIALRFDPRDRDNAQVVDALTAALVERGVVDVPTAQG
jgi:hypothetical protein